MLLLFHHLRGSSSSRFQCWIIQNDFTSENTSLSRSSFRFLFYSSIQSIWGAFLGFPSAPFSPVGSRLFFLSAGGTLSLWAASFSLWSLFWFGSPVSKPQPSALIPGLSRLLSFYSSDITGLPLCAEDNPRLGSSCTSICGHELSAGPRVDGGPLQSCVIPSPLGNTLVPAVSVYREPTLASPPTPDPIGCVCHAWWIGGTRWRTALGFWYA